MDLNNNYTKYSLYILSILIVFFFIQNTYLSLKKSEQILEILISTISITTAIIITFSFSKLFQEKQERITRKREIDKYFNLITSLRIIAFNIRTDNEFWSFSPSTKSGIDYKYPELTVEEFRNNSQNYSSELGGEIIPQAYLSLRGLDNSAQGILDINLKNYTLDELDRFINYCGHIHYFLDEQKENNHFSRISSNRLTKIKEEFFNITKKQTSESTINLDIKNIFCDFYDNKLHECVSLVNLNKKELPIHFEWIMINFIIYLFLLISSLLVYSLTLCLCIKPNITLFLISFFIVNTIDLTYGLYVSIKKELIIE